MGPHVHASLVLRNQRGGDPDRASWMDAETMVYLGMEWYPAWNRFISAKLLSVQLDVSLEEEDEVSSMPEACPNVPVPGAWISDYNIDFEGEEPPVFRGFFLSAHEGWGFSFWRAWNGMEPACLASLK